MNEKKDITYTMTPIGWAVVGILIVIIGYIFFHDISEMVRRWGSQEEYSHGYFIPFITLFLIWQRSEILRLSEFEGSWLGLVVVAIGFLLFFVSSLTTIMVIGQYGLIIVVVGLWLSFFGWKGLKPVFVPLLFLAFMIPLPAFLLNNLSSKLQLISSEIGVAVIRAFDISVYLEGNVIDLGQYKLQVVEACSGLNYLFPLMSLAFMAAYFFHAALWQRVVVFLSSIPITILMNSFRIGVIGVLVEYHGIEQAEGFLHDFEGWVVFMACTGLLITEMWLFTRISKDKRPLSEVFGIAWPEPAPANAEVRLRKLPAPFWGVFIVTGVAAGAVNIIQQREVVIPERAVFAEFPMGVGDWKGQSDRLEKIYLDALKLDDYIIADFTNASGESVNFYVAYYASQQAGESAHSPRSCLPGGGWVIEDIEQIGIDGVNLSGMPLMVNRAVIKKGEYTQLVYYWFQQRGRAITGEYLVKWYLLIDALAKNRTDGSLIRLTIQIGPGQALEDGDHRLQEFIKSVMPVLGNYIPD